MVFRHTWFGMLFCYFLEVQCHPLTNLQHNTKLTRAANLVKLPYGSLEMTSERRATRVRDLFAQSNWAGLIAWYTESRNERQRSREQEPPKSSNISAGRLIPAQVTNKSIVIQKFVDQISENFDESESNNRQGTMAIHGMAGAGKTSLAAYFAHLSENEKKYPITIWLQGNSEATLDSSVVDATRMLDLAKNRTQRSSVCEHCKTSYGMKRVSPQDIIFPCSASYLFVSDVLMHASLEIRWLAIIDNVDNFDLLNEYWPASLNRCTKGIKLSALDGRQSCDLLSLYLPKESLRDSTLITDLIETNMGEDAKKLHSYKLRGDSGSYKFTMATQWQITKEELEEMERETALALIGITMFLNNVNIPESVFALTGEIPANFVHLKALAQQGEFYEATSILMRQSLVSKDLEKTIHPLMHAIIFEAMSPDERQEAYESAAYLLWVNFPGKARDDEDMKLRWSLCNTYFPHVLLHLSRATEANVLKSRYSAQMIMHIARYAWEIGQFKEVASLLTICRKASQDITRYQSIDTGLIEAEALHFAG
ncbi:hypothetical protein B7494_g6877 [Chlorociboria aeruginascens]|nr:hypothetical protein B7494_g6877 [Chlorociboria aeruginascens]